VKAEKQGAEGALSVRCITDGIQALSLLITQYFTFRTGFGVLHSCREYPPGRTFFLRLP